MADRKADLTRRSYKEFMTMYQNMTPKEFRAFFTAQRDVVMKQLTRLSKSTGEKAQLASEYLKGPKHIRTLAEIDAMVRENSMNSMQAAREYVSALSGINYIYHAPRYSLKGWQKITKKIQQTLEKNGYGMISKKQLEIMGEIMARVYEIYGRKFAPSDEVMEAIAEGLGPKMMKMPDAELQNLLKNWKSRDNLETS